MPPLQPEQWREINPYLDEALSLPEEERAAWLAEFRENHAPLADLLHSLLCEHGALAQEQFLEHDLTEQNPVVGTQLGPYQIETLLGAGGMGEVYRARDTRLDRTVAIKILPRRFMSDPERRQRFEREARAISALQHPNICTLYDVGRHDNTDYLVMEYLEGQTLKDWVERTDKQHAPKRLTQLLDFATQICRGLEAAHQKGTIHRDIKPANIFVTKSGEAKILDFGLAKSLEGAEKAPESPTETVPATNVTMTRTGVAVGTPSYLSPEQVRGEQLDARSDLFSFGLVLYEMATGQRAFQGDTADAISDAVLNFQPQLVRKLNPHVPPELERIVAKALEKNREGRYQTAAQLRVALERLQKPAIWSWRKTAAVLVTLLVIGAGAYRWLRPKRIPFQKTKMTQLTTSGKVRVAAISPDGSEVAYSVDESGEASSTSSGTDDKESLWIRKESGDLQLIAPRAGRYGGLAFTRDGAFLYFVRSNIDDGAANSINRIPVQGGTEQQIIRDVAPPFDLTFSPNGQQIAFVRETEDQSFLMGANIDGSGVRQLAARKFPAGFELSAWSPSGETIASFGYNTEKGIDSGIPIEITLKDGKERPITSRHWYSFWGIQWISDGSGLIAMTQEQNAAPSHMSYLSRESGQATRLTNELDNFTGASLTADSRTLATVRTNTLDDLWVGSLTEQDSIKPISFGGRSEEPGWSSDGQILYLQPLEVGDEIRTVASDGSNSKRLAVNNAGRDFHLRICRAARKIVFASERSGQDHVWTMDLDGQNPKQLTNSPYDVNGFPDCSADGKWVFYGKSGPEKGIWKIPMEGGDSVRLTDQHATVPVVSPDGKLIAYYFQNEPGNPSKGLAIMSSEGGPPLRKFPVYFQYARLRWFPDSKSLLLIRGQKGVSNLWQQPINGDPPRQVTHFNADQIFGFDLSPDGRQVVMQRGRNTRDVVLIHDLQ